MAPLDREARKSGASNGGAVRESSLTHWIAAAMTEPQRREGGRRTRWVIEPHGQSLLTLPSGGGRMTLPERQAQTL